MTATQSLHALIAPAYFAEATKAAKARHWVEAAANLDQYKSLLPGDYRAPLFRAKIYLREGRLAECLAALEDARRLGHERSEIDRMIAWLRDRDRRRHDRLAFRNDVEEQVRSLLRSVGEHLYLLRSNLWSKWSAHLLFAGWVIATSMLYYLIYPS